MSVAGSTSSRPVIWPCERASRSASTAFLRPVVRGGRIGRPKFDGWNPKSENDLMTGERLSSTPELAKPLPSREEGRADWLWVAAGVGIIFLVVFAVYWRALGGQFLWDDLLVVHRNPLVTGELGLGSLWFRTDFPLTNVVFLLEWLAWGNHPVGYHVANVLLHATSAVLLWSVLGRVKVPAVGEVCI